MNEPKPDSSYLAVPSLTAENLASTDWRRRLIAEADAEIAARYADEPHYLLPTQSDLFKEK